MTLALVVLQSLAVLAGPAKPPAADTKLLSYNVLFDSDRNADSVALIDSEDADIVCLTELTKPFVKTLLEKVGKRYPHRALAPKVGTWGVGLLSKHPIRASEVFPQLPHKIPGMRAEIVIDGKPLTVACLHFIPPIARHRKSDSLLETMDKNAELRKQQAKGLVDRFARVKTPIVLSGDFNEAKGDAGVQLLLGAGYSAACDLDGAECGATWPGATSFAPALTQIDHILGKGVRFSAAQVVRGGGSDHYPVEASFSLAR